MRTKRFLKAIEAADFRRLMSRDERVNGGVSWGAPPLTLDAGMW
jgi:hypothetical protein